MTAAKVKNAIARLPDCDGQAADAVSAYTQVKMEDAPRWLRIPKSECPQIWVLLPRHKWPTSWSNIEGRVVPLERTLYGHPLAGLLWWRQLSNGSWMGQGSKLGMLVCSSKTKIILICTRGWYQNGGRESEYGSHVEEIDEECRSWRTNIIFLPRTFGMHSTWMKTERRHFQSIKRNVRITNFCWSNSKISRVGNKPRQVGRVALRHGIGMLQNALKEIASWRIKKTEQLYKVSRLCLDDHNFKKEELESVGELSKVCSQIVFTCLYLARIGRPDVLWSMNKLARSVTKWTGACDWRVAHLISYIHHTSDCRQPCHKGNTAQHCRLGLFPDSDFDSDLEES